MDYTAWDHDTCLLVVQQEMAKAFPKWTDYNRASPGNNLLRAFCHVLDILSVYQNNQARETFLGTVQRRRNMIAIARGFGVTLKGQAAASVDLTFTLATALANDVVIPAGTRVDTAGLDEVIQFYTTAALRIVAGGTSGIVSARNATPRTDSFVSDGSPDQVFPLTFSPFVEDSDAMTIGVDTWQRVPNFFNSGPSSKHYVVIVDEFERAFVVFGNGVNGQVPTQSDQIDVTYETGGGSDGNVQADTITRLRTTLVDTGGNAASATVTNVTAATGGADRETVERARRRLPGALRVLTRCVSREDFEIVALGVPGVARSMFLTTDEDATIPDNEGRIIVIPEGDPPGLPSTDLKNKVVAEVTVVYPTMVTFHVEAEDPSFLDVDVVAEIRLKDGYTFSEVEANIQADLAAFFATQQSDGAPNPTIDFGANLKEGLLAWSDIFKVVASAEGVSRVEEDTFLPADDVVVDKREFPRLDDVTITEL